MKCRFIELDGTIINVDEIAKVNLVENVAGQETGLLVVSGKREVICEINAPYEYCEQMYMDIKTILTPVSLEGDQND